VSTRGQPTEPQFGRSCPLVDYVLIVPLGFTPSSHISRSKSKKKLCRTLT
jgi:hypothetical protein